MILNIFENVNQFSNEEDEINTKVIQILKLKIIIVDQPYYVTSQYGLNFGPLLLLT